jgi:ATP-dependent RNA helicase RhlE
MPFASLGLRPEIAKAVREAGYTEPTPIQVKAIPAILGGNDLVGVAQTGTGKTAAFVLPLLERLAVRPAQAHTRALIIAPTRELVVQIAENLRAYSKHLHVRSVMVYGGVGEQPQIAALRRGVDVIIATPGRLLDLMHQGHARLAGLQYLVLDEGDRMLDMGFLPSIRRIIAAIPKERQTMLFSATFSREIEQIAAEFLRNPEMVEVAPRLKPAETISQGVHEVPHEQKSDLLLHLLQDSSLRSVLIFSRTKHGADKIARKLEAAGHATATIHSNRSQVQRQRALESFRAGRVRILVATDIAARGIDVDGISHVINFDFPHVPEDYVHRIGRTGRASLNGEAISFVTAEDRADLRKVESIVGRRIERRTAEGFVVRRETITSTAPGAQRSHAPSRHSAPAYRKADARTSGARGGAPNRSRNTQGRPGGESRGVSAARGAFGRSDAAPRSFGRRQRPRP